MEKINIAELLKDCPKGMELYSPLFGNCKFIKVHDYKAEIIVEIETGANVSFKTDGRYFDYPNAECILFPKGKTTWEGFQRPFKDGDVIYTYNFIAILSHIAESGAVWYHCYYCISTKNFNAKHYCGIGNINNDEFRLATEEEKEKLFQAIKDNGYKWNAETKTLEKLPKFKVGDRLIYIHDKEMYMNEPIYVKRIECNRYILNNGKYIPFYDQDDFELAPNKFDITTLKPFQKVLVRDSDSDSDKEYWSINLFGFYNEITKQFLCMGNTNIGWDECIPYEGNEHLLGTTNDCDEYFKTW